MTKIDFSAIENIPTEAVHFFKIMMRLEYALKVIGFGKMDGDRIEICWDRYANERFGKDGFKAIRENKKAKTLIDTPPKKQVIKQDGKLDFRDVAKVTSVQELLGAVRRVRNNLFHGGKSGDPDHDRNDALIAEATCVITEMLLADEDLRITFEGRY